MQVGTRMLMPVICKLTEVFRSVNAHPSLVTRMRDTAGTSFAARGHTRPASGTGQAPHRHARRRLQARHRTAARTPSSRPCPIPQIRHSDEMDWRGGKDECRRDATSLTCGRQSFSPIGLSPARRPVLGADRHSIGSRPDSLPVIRNRERLPLHPPPSRQYVTVTIRSDPGARCRHGHRLIRGGQASTW